MVWEDGEEEEVVLDMLFPSSISRRRVPVAAVREVHAPPLFICHQGCAALFPRIPFFPFCNFKMLCIFRYYCI